jgi:hypothetical protein
MKTLHTIHVPTNTDGLEILITESLEPETITLSVGVEAVTLSREQADALLNTLRYEVRWEFAPTEE